MLLSGISRGTHLFSHLNKPIHQSPFKPRHLLQAVAPRYNFYGASNYNICGGEFCFGYRRFISMRENDIVKLSGYNVKRPSSSINLSRQYATHASIEKKSNKMLLYLTGLVFAMVGCSYAAVPLYRRFCQATGYGGTVQRRESVEEKIARHTKDGTLTTRCGFHYLNNHNNFCHSPFIYDLRDFHLFPEWSLWILDKKDGENGPNLLLIKKEKYEET
ncbi:cytochrome c oxidase assembly COX11, mitochondrial [Olea europaea subsp. europaea]|uniref:Cytochrome c oxidase assembly COX11, mitochondrial n=1 Tax=Olea europaea subsp. europaea TaxID=158383 RepID=A0A8S0RCA9_OLEEU|nr:cytochrome c oxidase assembly COX11, mitochondrial [Olea europaea subsp. europaea]